MSEATGEFILYVSERVAGRFSTSAGAEDEEERLCRLALKDGRAITTAIRWNPPVPRTEQELADAMIDARLY